MNGTLSWQFLVVLGHFLWQGAVVAGLLGVSLAVLRGRSARVRYGVCVGALAVMAVCPVATVLWGMGVWEGAGRDASDGRDLRELQEGGTAGGVLEARPGIDTAASGGEPARFGDPRPHLGDLRAYAPYVLAFYLAGVSLMLLRLAAALGGGKRLRRFSEPVEDGAVLQALARQACALGLKATPAVAWCGKVLTPTVVGVLRPIVLLPASVVTGLAAGQLELLLLHELAHVRRYDPLVNVLQRLIEAALFFHPAVWYVSRQVRVEREQCCDDVVLAHGGEPRAYAESLLQAATLAHMGRSGLAAAGGIGVLGGGTDLRKRMRRVLGLGAQPVRLMHGGALLCLLAAGLAAAAFAGTAELGEANNPEPAPVAQAPETAEAPAPAAEPQPVAPQGSTASVEELVLQLKLVEDWWLRKVAAQQLGEVKFSGLHDDLVTTGLVVALNDENHDVKMAAARSLGLRGDPRAIKYLVATLKDEEEEVRRAAVEALSKFPEERVLPILQYAATDKDNRDPQLGAVKVLGGMKSAAALDVLVRAVARPYSSDIVEVLAESLKKYPWEEVEPRLRTLARSSDEREVVSLLWLLWHLDKPELDDLIVELSRVERSHITAIYAAARLVKRREGKGSAELVEVLHGALREPSEEARKSAGESLYGIGWEPPTVEDRAWLLSAVGEWEKAASLGEVAVEPLLLALRTKTDDRQRQTPEVANALAAIDSPQVLPAIVEVLRGLEKKIREEPQGGYQSAATGVIKAVEKAGGEEAVDALIEAAQSEGGTVRWAAVNALGRMKAEKGIPAIIEVMRNVPVGREQYHDAVWAVAELGGEGSAEAVADFVIGSLRGGSWASWVDDMAKRGTERAAEVLKVTYLRAGETSPLRPRILASLGNSRSAPMQRVYRELNPGGSEGSESSPPARPRVPTQQ